MDLAVWKAAFAKPWANVYQWPILRWLDPDLPVRLWKEDGTQDVWMAGQTFRPGVGSSRFDAVELPADLLLVRQLVLPAMPPEQLGQAIALDVKTLSPFPAQDLVWGYTSSVQEGGSILAHMVLASRQQVDAYLLARRVQLGLNAHEVWAMAAPDKPVVLPGWNESLRQQNRVKRRRAGYGLLGLACILVMAAVVTPVAQSRLRAIEAAIAHSDLQGRAGALLAQREAMQQAVDRIGQIKNVLAERPDGVLVLEALTKALPDDTYLGTLDVTGLKVRIVGLTANAAALMQSLGAQTGFRDVRAPVPAVRNPGSALENFSIEFQLDPATFSAAVGSASPREEKLALPASSAASGVSRPAEEVSGASEAAKTASASAASASVAPASKSRFSSGGDVRAPVKPTEPAGGK